MTPRGDTGESQRLTTEWWAKAWARVGCRIRADFYLRHFLVCTVNCASRATEHRSITHLLTTIVKKPDFVFWDADYAYGKREESFGLPLVL